MNRAQQTDIFCSKQSRAYVTGFTLIEVMIALMILSIALTAIVLATIQNSKNIIYLRNKTLAQWATQNVMVEYQLGLRSVPITLEPQHGTEILLGQSWYWSVTFNPTPNKSILDIQISVSAQENGESVQDLKSYLKVE